MKLGHVLHVVRAERRDGHLRDQPAVQVEQAQHLRAGKAASLGLLAALPEVFLERRRVGHGQARAIGDPHAVTMPAIARCAAGSGRVIHSLRAGLEHLQRKPASGRAVTGGGKSPAAQTRYFSTRNVSGGDLPDEQRDGIGRLERRVAPLQLQFVADVFNDRVTENRTRAVLDPIQRAGDTDHPWPPVGW